MFRLIFILSVVIAISGNDSFLRIKCRRQPGQQLSGPCRRFLQSPTSTITPTQSTTATVNHTQVPTTQGTADQEASMAHWLAPLIVMLLGGSYAGGVAYLRFRFNFGARHSFALGLTLFCVRAENRFEPEANSLPQRVDQNETELQEIPSR